VDEVKPAGFHSVDWDGRDREGRKLASGLYFYRLTVPGYSQIQKMLLLQ
jgi:flagellar hook assembly protein FlgD